MGIETRLNEEIRTTDEYGALVRVHVYQEMYIIGPSSDQDAEIPGALQYVTDDGHPCKLRPDGSFQIVLDGRVLKRIG